MSNTARVSDAPPSLFEFDDEPRVRVTDPLTSHEAADSTAPTRKQSQDLVHEQLRRSGPQAAYQVEFALRFKGVSASRVRTALVELEKLSRAERLPHRDEEPPRPQRAGLGRPMIAFLASCIVLGIAAADGLFNGADLLGWILVGLTGARLMRKAARA